MIGTSPCKARRDWIGGTRLPLGLIALVLALCSVSCSDDSTRPSEGSLVVLVRNSVGVAVTGAWVVVQDSGVPGQATDVNGFATFENVESGVYRIVVSEPRHGGGSVAARVEPGRQKEAEVRLSTRTRLEPRLFLFSPEDDDLFTAGKIIDFVGTVYDPDGPSKDLRLVLKGETVDILLFGSPAEDGSFSLSADAVPKGRHVFSLEVTNAGGFSVVDTVHIGVTIAAATLNPPAYEGGAVRLSWTRVEDPDFDFYEVARSTDLDPGVETTIAILDDAETNSYVDLEPPRGRTLSYRIRTVDREGHDSYSESRWLVIPATQIAFPYTFGDAEIHPSEPLVYLTAPSHRAIYRVNYETETLVDSLFFDFEVERLAFHATKTTLELYATLLTHYHDWTLDDERQTGYLAVLDPDRMEIGEIRLLDIDPFDVVPGRDGFLYIPSGSGQHSRIRSVPRRGFDPGISSNLYSGCLAQLHPTYDRIYAVGYNDRASFDVEHGRFAHRRSMEISGTAFAISPDGGYFFSNVGDVYACHADSELDLKAVGQLPFPWTAIGFDEEARRVFVANGYQVHILSLGSWDSLGQFPIMIEAQRLFYRDQNLIVIGSGRGGFRTEVQVVRL